MSVIARLKVSAFTQIGHRILAVVGGVVCVGLVALVLFYADRQERNVHAQNERTLIKVTESVAQGLRTVMEAGYADIGQMLFERLKGVGDLVDLRILRPDGTEAFHDNRTIATVNRRLEEERFRAHKVEDALAVLPADDPYLRHAVATGRTVTYTEGKSLFTLLAPVANGPECHRCHGDDHQVRGVIKLTTSTAKIQEDVRNTWIQSMIVLAAALTVMLATVGVMIRRAVVRPIRRITTAMERVATGDLSSEVPVQGGDELAQMAHSFNRMMRELLRMYSGLEGERNKLSTILLGAQEGILVTDREGAIVLVNPAAERLLDKSGQRIVAEGLLYVLDDAEWVAERRSRAASGGVPELFRYRDKVFSVLIGSIAGDAGECVGTAMLIRDVTSETRLREELQRQSDTDGLTGIYNRRYFDQRLADEFALSRRYGTPVSLFLFDVDHFKKFNDTYGHEQGDRVLQAIGKAMLATADEPQVCCRYGGEEFVAILPGDDIDAATAAAERLRAHVEAMAVDGLKVTISIGVASMPPTHPAHPDDLVKLADTAMYAAKDGGRNQVRAAGAER